MIKFVSIVFGVLLFSAWHAKGGTNAVDQYEQRAKSIIFPKFTLHETTTEEAIEQGRQSSKKYSSDGKGLTILFDPRPAPPQKLLIPKTTDPVVQAGFDRLTAEYNQYVEPLILQAQHDTNSDRRVDTVSFDQISALEALQYIIVGTGFSCQIHSDEIAIAQTIPKQPEIRIFHATRKGDADFLIPGHGDGLLGWDSGSTFFLEMATAYIKERRVLAVLLVNPDWDVTEKIYLDYQLIEPTKYPDDSLQEKKNKRKLDQSVR